MKDKGEDIWECAECAAAMAGTIAGCIAGGLSGVGIIGCVSAVFGAGSTCYPCICDVLLHYNLVDSCEL